MIVCDVFFNQKQQCHLDHVVTLWLTLEPSILEHLRLQLQVLGRTYWNESIHPWDAGSDYILYDYIISSHEQTFGVPALWHFQSE